MRSLGIAVLLLVAPVFATERFPEPLTLELSPPALDQDGCALQHPPDGIFNKQKLDDGALQECGAYVDGRKVGYWVLLQSGASYYWHGWFKEGKRIGTWLARTPSGSLVGLLRYDLAGNRHGISYGLGLNGQFVWKEIHAHGNTISTCDNWKSPC